MLWSGHMVHEAECSLVEPATSYSQQCRPRFFSLAPLFFLASCFFSFLLCFDPSS